MKVRYIVMHESESGYQTPELAKQWIADNRAEYADEKSWRVVAVIMDPESAGIAAEHDADERARCYAKGKEAARAEIRAKLGL